MFEPRVNIIKTEVLSDNWYTLNKITFELEQANGDMQLQNRESYDRGNGATILLYNKASKSVVLTRQFRMPTYVNGNPTGMLIETCAGLLDADSPEVAIKREVEEETGYRLSNVQKVFQAYMSPGSVTEVIHFFVAEYEADMKVSDGGGHEDEQENIEVLELPFAQAVEMMASGQICDGKTIMSLQYAQIHHLVG